MTSDDCNVKSIIRGKKEERKVLEIEKKRQLLTRNRYLHHFSLSTI